MKKILVLGGGSWGTTLGNLLAEKDCDVSLWARNSKIFKIVKNNLINNQYLPKYKLSKNLKIISDLKDAFKDVDLVIIAIPSKGFRSISSKISKYLDNHKILIASKGIENKSFMTMSEVFVDETNHSKKNIMVLSGPNIADEIMRKNISASVIAGSDKKSLKNVSDLFNRDFFKIFLSNDTKGIEMAGALKNLYAICSGLSDGLGFESNTKAMLLTRSLSEMSELFRKINANPLTLLGLSGVGDLIATSSSEKSRNYSFGKLLGKGNSPNKALSMVKQSVEGYRTLKVLYLEKNKLSLNMPIIDALYKIVYLKKDPKKCFLKFIHESGNIDTAYD